MEIIIGILAARTVHGYRGGESAKLRNGRRFLARFRVLIRISVQLQLDNVINLCT